MMQNTKYNNFFERRTIHASNKAGLKEVNERQAV